MFGSHGFKKRYLDLRNSISALQQRVLDQASKTDIHGAAKELHMLRRKQIVFANESEMPVFADYLAYAYRLNGVNLMDRFRSLHGSVLTAQEQDLLERMRSARFRLLLIQSKGTEGLLNALDIIESRSLPVADMGLWKTATPGAGLASRVIDLGEYGLLTGGAVRFDQALLQRDEVKHAMETIAGRHDHSQASNDLLARALIRAAIQMEYTGGMRFE